MESLGDRQILNSFASLFTKPTKFCLQDFVYKDKRHTRFYLQKQKTYKILFTKLYKIQSCKYIVYKDNKYEILFTKPSSANSL